MAITARRLAALLFEELERDSWGDVDPFWIGMVADGLYGEGGDPDDDHREQADALAKVFERVAERLRKEG